MILRGLWLVILEFSIVNFGLFFDPDYHTIIFEVIAAIGFGFIVLSAMLKLSAKAIGFTGLIIIIFHGLLPLIPTRPGSATTNILSFLFSSGAFQIFGTRVFIMGYPPIPWLGIMLVGFAAGNLFELPSHERKSVFIRIGVGSLFLFILLRYINIYGDPSQWSSQKTFMFSFLSFMNISKYPPSLLFCLVTWELCF